MTPIASAVLEALQQAERPLTSADIYARVEAAETKKSAVLSLSALRKDGYAERTDDGWRIAHASAAPNEPARNVHIELTDVDSAIWTSGRVTLTGIDAATGMPVHITLPPNAAAEHIHYLDRMAQP